MQLVCRSGWSGLLYYVREKCLKRERERGNTLEFYLVNTLHRSVLGATGRWILDYFCVQKRRLTSDTFKVSQLFHLHLHTDKNMHTQTSSLRAKTGRKTHSNKKWDENVMMHLSMQNEHRKYFHAFIYL